MAHGQIAPPAGPAPQGAAVNRLWRRSLPRYPNTAARYWYLAIAVFATIVLYYELYVIGAVTPLLLAHYKMSFPYYVNALVISNLLGAFGSLIAGLADRWGRANLVAYGLGVTGLLCLLTPLAPTKLIFVVFLTIIGLVEGMILVATPALVRDFSPQLGRASAMGFWTLGPVVGSLVVGFVANRTLPVLHTWASQYHIVGVVGLVTFVIALIGLRELAPGLRDQVMVTMADRDVVEARAEAARKQANLERPWRQMLHVDIVLPAFGISIFLLIYYTAVGFFTIYLTTNFGFSTATANGINAWYWGVNAVALVIVGALSDRLRVRKPFMLVGALLTVVMTFIFLTRATHPHTGAGTLIWIISLLAIGLATAFAPWMAAFSETVERRNPALIATGLAIWGWLQRLVVCASFFVVPYVVSSFNTLVDAPAVLAKAHQLPHGTPPPAPLAHRLAEIKAATVASPHQWQHWWWICIAVEIAFIGLMLPLAGRWSPKAARADIAAHERDLTGEAS